MKNISLLILTLAFFGGACFFEGCADKEAEAKIESLTRENKDLLHKADSLQHTLDSLNAFGDSVKKSLQRLDMNP